MNIKTSIRILLLSLSALSLNTAYADANHLAEAEQFFAKGAYADAKHSYRAHYADTGITTTDKQNLCDECWELQAAAKVFINMGNRDDAWTVYTKLLHFNPDDPYAKEFISNYKPTQARENKIFTNQNILVVQKDDDTQLLFFKNPEAISLNYPEANQYCKNLIAGNYASWRLPTMDELRYYYRDYPSEMGKFYWVDYKGVIVNGKEASYFENNTNFRYFPSIDGRTLKVHPATVNALNELIDDEPLFLPFLAVREIKL